MELLQLQYFIKVAELEHMSQAAKELFISQSSLSRSILRLEESLGVQLFDREGRNIRLNSYGRNYLEHVRRVFWELEEGQREIDEAKSRQNTPVTILSTIPDILDDLPDLFYNAPFHVKIRQKFVRRDQLSAALQDSAVDFAISELPDSAHGLETEDLFGDELYFVIARSHPLAASDTVRLKELEHEDVLAPPQGAGLRTIADEFFSIYGIIPNILNDEMNTTISKKALTIAAQQRGIVYISKYALYRFLQTQPHGWDNWFSEVKVMRISEPDCRWQIGTTRISRRHYSPVSEKIYAYVKAGFHEAEQEMEALIEDFFRRNALPET